HVVVHTDDQRSPGLIDLSGGNFPPANQLIHPTADATAPMLAVAERQLVDPGQPKIVGNVVHTQPVLRSEVDWILNGATTLTKLAACLAALPGFGAVVVQPGPGVGRPELESLGEAALKGGLNGVVSAAPVRCVAIHNVLILRPQSQRLGHVT